MGIDGRLKGVGRRSWPRVVGEGQGARRWCCWEAGKRRIEPNGSVSGLGLRLALNPGLKLEVVMSTGFSNPPPLGPSSRLRCAVKVPQVCVGGESSMREGQL